MTERICRFDEKRVAKVEAFCSIIAAICLVLCLGCLLAGICGLFNMFFGDGDSRLMEAGFLWSLPPALTCALFWSVSILAECLIALRTDMRPLREYLGN